LNSISANEELWVIVGWDGVILTSKDLTNWKKQKSNTSSILTSITFGNGIFIVVGYNGQILISNDGINWNKLTLSSDLSFENISFLNNKFIALGQNGKILISENGINWFPKNSNTTYTLNSCTLGKDSFNKDVYAIVGKNGKILLSYDLENFENIELNFKQDIFKVIYENNLFIATSTKGNILISKDARNWEIIQTNVNEDLFSVIYAKLKNTSFTSLNKEDIEKLGSNYFVGVFTEKKKKISLEKFVLTKTPCKNDLLDIVSIDNIFIVSAKNGNLLISQPLENNLKNNLNIKNNKNLISWELINLNINNHLRSIAFNENNIVIVGDNGIILKNEISDKSNLLDYSKWSKLIFNNISFNCISFGNDIWIAVGLNGKILISQDLNNWEPFNHDFLAHFTSVIPFNDYFVISGLMGIILILEQDIGLFKSNTNTEKHIYSLATNNDLVIAVGANGTILKSYDLKKWYEIKSPVNEDLLKVIYSNNLFIAVGQKGSLIISEDGNTWYKKNTTINKTLYSVAYKDLVIAVSEKGNIIHNEI
ncbi:MAG: WD40/YVTN/BNR-like repeat-containing protein, partial [bacterium]